MLSIFVGALMQPTVGYMIDRVAGARAYHVESLTLLDFQQGLNLLPLCAFVALLLSFFIKETNCRPQYAAHH